MVRVAFTFLGLMLLSSAVQAQAEKRIALLIDNQSYGSEAKTIERRTSGHRSKSSGNSDYYEHDADKLPIGTSRWFEQMRREGRFGGGGG